jgi:hypothetical protein
MTTQRNTQVLLASRPTGLPDASSFRIVESEPAALAEGEIRVRSHYLSLDPYMRGRMSDARSYVKPVEVGAVMCGEAAGEVVESRNARFAVGDLVQADFGWQEYPVSDGKGVRKLNPALSMTAQLSAAGMTGITAWFGLNDLCQPKPGETVVVSAAAGAVGSIVGQIAKLRGARAVGIAGGAEKCRIVVEEYGFDACVDYKAPGLREALKQAAPQGVDGYFDNVGGAILDTVLGQMNVHGRVAVCGLISQYNATEAYGVKNFRSILVNRLRIQGFIVFDFAPRYREAQAELAQWITEGKLRWRETIAQGLRSAPGAFIGLLQGANVGKQLVKLV